MLRTFPCMACSTSACAYGLLAEHVNDITGFPALGMPNSLIVQVSITCTFNGTCC